jgi:hypothetical protein
MISISDLRSGQRASAVVNSTALRRLAIPLIGLLGVVLVALPEVVRGRMPGDLGDSRFNAYVLEHGYLWLAGRTASFWDAPFFYPFPLTIAFSDNHLGTAVVYDLLRLLGYDRDDAYRGWYLFGFVANFIAASYALRRLGHSYRATALGAFLFAFALPVTAQSLHTQLSYRFGVPLAILALVRFERSRRLEYLLATGFWTVWQFYCTIYIGYFLCLLLGAFAVASAVHRAGATPLSYWPRLMLVAWGNGSARAHPFPACRRRSSRTLARLVLSLCRNKSALRLRPSLA